MTILETRWDSILPTLATKLDIVSLKLEIESVKVDIRNLINETHRWIIATVIGLFFGFGALFLAMSNALKPTPPTAVAPIVISVPAPSAPSAPAPVPAQREPSK